MWDPREGKGEAESKSINIRVREQTFNDKKRSRNSNLICFLEPLLFIYTEELARANLGFDLVQ